MDRAMNFIEKYYLKKYYLWTSSAVWEFSIHFYLVGLQTFVPSPKFNKSHKSSNGIHKPRDVNPVYSTVSSFSSCMSPYKGDTCKASENTDVSDIVSDGISFFSSTLFFAQYITLQIFNWVYQNYTSILLSELESHSSGIKLIFKIPIVCLTDQQCYRCWQNVSVEQIFPNKPHLPYTLEFFKRTTRIPNSSYIYLEWTQDV